MSRSYQTSNSIVDMSREMKDETKLQNYNIVGNLNKGSFSDVIETECCMQ